MATRVHEAGVEGQRVLSGHAVVVADTVVVLDVCGYPNGTPLKYTLNPKADSFSCINIRSMVWFLQ